MSARREYPPHLQPLADELRRDRRRRNLTTAFGWLLAAPLVVAASVTISVITRAVVGPRECTSVTERDEQGRVLRIATECD